MLATLLSLDEKLQKIFFLFGCMACAFARGAVYLDLGMGKNMVRVILKGTDLSVLCTAPWRVDVSSALREKNNDLQIQVVTLCQTALQATSTNDDGITDGKWPERLLRGKPRTGGRYTFTSTKLYSKNSPLLGPVTITVQTQNK